MGGGVPDARFATSSLTGKLADGDLGGDHRTRDWWVDTSGATGVVFQRSRVRLGSLPDGATSTYLVGEKYVGFPGYDSDEDPGHDGTLLTGIDVDVVRWSHVPPLPDGGAAGLDTARAFGSAHAAGFQMAFCDGRVRTLDYLIDPDVHRWQGNRRDGEAFDVE